MKHLMLLLAVVAGTLTVGAFVTAGNVAAQGQGDATRGKALYVKNGCYECHGYLGQGNLAGAGVALAPHPVPYPNFAAYVRNPAQDMLPYSVKILPEADLRDIYAYIASIPAGKRAAEIPLLNVSTGNAGPPQTLTPELAHGAQVFGDICAKCHIAAPVSGARNLPAAGVRTTLPQLVEWIKNPGRGMPKLDLTESEIQDVAAYVMANYLRAPAPAASPAR